MRIVWFLNSWATFKCYVAMVFWIRYCILHSYYSFIVCLFMFIVCSLWLLRLCQTEKKRTKFKAWCVCNSSFLFVLASYKQNRTVFFIIISFHCIIHTHSVLDSQNIHVFATMKGFFFVHIETSFIPWIVAFVMCLFSSMSFMRFILICLRWLICGCVETRTWLLAILDCYLWSLIMIIIILFTLCEHLSFFYLFFRLNYDFTNYLPLICFFCCGTVWMDQFTNMCLINPI